MSRRFCYWFLIAIFIVVIVLDAIRPLRVSPLYQMIGVIQFAAVVWAAWTLGARAITASAREPRLLALAGIFLVTPCALMALLWPGLGPPWVATPPENQMRYLVLAAMTISIVVGFVVLREALGEADKNSVGFATILLAGPLYLIFDAFGFGIATARLDGEGIPPAFHDLNAVIDLILFLAGALTYIAAAAFAISLGQAKWIGLGAARAFAIVSLVALLLLVIRGLHFPDPHALSAPWYTNPGFIVGIPAVPFIIPFLFGVILLRRAGESDAAPAP
ncbi:MAG TPA: hypothetical protein VNW72_08730 [Chthoniobacterales bacterium]|jgi:hypothetical protein|nr:hypothetical protein [Chthoniobacterales bacterium]